MVWESRGIGTSHRLEAIATNSQREGKGFTDNLLVSCSISSLSPVPPSGLKQSLHRLVPPDRPYNVSQTANFKPKYDAQSVWKVSGHDRKEDRFGRSEEMLWIRDRRVARDSKLLKGEVTHISVDGEKYGFPVF